MTPKEKAEELYNKYLILIVDDIIDMKIIYGTLTHKLAKQSTLIAVDEIINCDYFFNTLKDTKKFTSYWYEVQQEIEKL
jgi:hypothetical protein